MRIGITARLVMLVMLAPIASRAQVVRGTVTQRESGTVPGVVVTLERRTPGATDALTAGSSALTDEKGEYAIRAAEPGRYRVSAKRIGVKRFLSPEFDLTAGETKRIDIVLDAVLFTLPTVMVAANTFCLARPAEAQRVAALWDETRTALTAAQISLRDRLFTGRATRYVREVDPKSFKVLSESRADLTGVLYKPASTVSADSLSRAGYWWDVPDRNTQVYNAPDGDVLTSGLFVRDHCFDAVEGGRNRRGLVGLAFEPSPVRTVGDIRGTLWLDARTFELRFLEFRYTRLHTADSSSIGGELHFARLPNGAWLIRRWFIRMPQFARYAEPPVTADLRRPMVLIRPGVYRLIEEGGDVFADGLRLFEKPAVVTGVVLDSAGAPLGGAVVRLAGTPFSASADDAGRFRLDSLPAGSHTIIAEHPSYGAFGMPVDDQSLTLEEGVTERVTLRGSGGAAIVARLCDGKPPARRRSTLHLTVLDQDANQPLGSLDVWLRWRRGVQDDSNLVKYDGVQSRTDQKGVVDFCDLPPEVALEVHLLRPGDSGVSLKSEGWATTRSVRVAEFTLSPNEIAARTVKTRRPR